MPEVTSYDAGVPAWVDMGTPDVPAALRFYSDLFGWTADDQGEEAGHYTICSKNGKQVAAISGQQNPGEPPYWTTYIATDDADATSKRVEAAGGTVIVAPFDVLDAGRMAVYRDTTGAFVSVWQAGNHTGAQLVNEPGSPVWNELNTSDLATSKEFYGEVFGWTFGGGDEYAEAQVGGRSIAGLMPKPAMVPAEVPDHWLVYFAAADVDASTAQATKLGATLLAGPMDIPGGGRFSVVMDPQGAAFGLFQHGA